MRILKQFRRNKTFTAGAIIILLLILVSIFAPVIAPYSYVDNVGPRNAPPSSAHLFGTDNLGRDLLSRVIYGAPLALKTCLVVSTVSIVLGLFFGLTSGYYYGGVWDSIVQFIINILMSIPAIVLVVGIVGAIGQTLDNAIIAFAVVGWSHSARMVRAKTQVILGTPFVEAAKAFGERDSSIILRYILPNIASTLIVMFTMSMPGALLSTAAISFLGLGAQPPMPDWGAMLSGAHQYMTSAPWMMIFPGAVLTLVALGINWFGEGLRDMFDLAER